jgi:Fe-S cluster biogenesis protein NfuA
MFIQTEDTPNPATLKFVPGRLVMTSGTADFPNQEAARQAPLAENLFKIQGVSGVFFGDDFVTVTKTSDFDWSLLKPDILGTLVNYFVAHKSVEINASSKSTIKDDGIESPEIVKEIKDLLDTRIRPMVAMDGGDIIFQSFKSGVVYLLLQGSCSGCPSSTATLKDGIENLLRHYIPEVTEVRAVEN